MVMETPRLKQVLPEKNWTSQSSVSTLEKLSPKLKDDMCTILLDARNDEPEVFEVVGNYVFQTKHPEIIRAKTIIIGIKEVLGTLEAKSNPELMECLQQSREDKKKGRLRKFDDVARECGLSL